MSVVAVRPVRPGDLPAVGALTAEAYRADGLLAEGDDYETELRDVERRLAEATVLVATTAREDRWDGAEPGEEVVGTITLAPYGSTYAETAGPGEWELRMLAVAPRARGQGVAADLVLGAAREAVAAGARSVVLSTLDAMRTAHRLYERLGFVRAPGRDWHHEDVSLRVFTWTPPASPGALVEASVWPPLRTEVVAGWRLGVSAGLTRRANSVLALTAPADVEAAIDEVERRYATHLLPATFRVDADTRPADLADRLAARGYAAAAVTDVLVAPLDGADGFAASPHLDVAVSDAPDEHWLAAFTGAKGGDAATARALLTGSPARYLTALSGGRRVGILRLAFADGWAGLAALAVDPAARRRGVARGLTTRALALAADHTQRAFLQLEVGNHAAWRLYARLGFRPAARYTYLTR